MRTILLIAFLIALVGGIAYAASNVQRRADGTKEPRGAIATVAGLAVVGAVMLVLALGWQR